jgi:hypothetical protein
MLSLEITRALLSPETRKVLSLPTAALILGALSQVENLVELVDRVCDPVFRRSANRNWNANTTLNPVAGIAQPESQ